MKAAILVLVSFSFLTSSVSGQTSNAKEIVERGTREDQKTPAPDEENSPEAAPAETQAPEAAPAETAPAVTPERPVQPVPRVVMPPIRPKTEEEKLEIERKTVEFQTKRAEEGSATAQYDLGMRYLNGEGVEQNEETARQLLSAAAQQGHTAATQKIRELSQKKQ